MLKTISLYYLKRFLGFKNLEAFLLSDSGSEHLAKTSLAGHWDGSPLNAGFQGSPLPHGCWQGALVFSLMGLSIGLLRTW